MKQLTLTVPTFGFIVATRAALAFGAGLLVSGKLPETKRRALGLTLVAIGAVSALLTLVSGWLYGAVGPAGFWVMAALCAAALPFTRRL